MPHTDIPERVSSLEASMESLSREVRETNDNIMQVANTMERGFQNIHNLLTEQQNKTSEELKNQSKTNWPLLFSVFGVVATISGWWVTYSTMDMRLDLAVIKHQMRIDDARKEQQLKLLDLLEP